jgi:hypothetical protein
MVKLIFEEAEKKKVNIQYIFKYVIIKAVKQISRIVDRDGFG